MAPGAAGLYLLVLLGLAVLVLVWVLLPFGIFGIKPRLDLILAEQRAILAELRAWRAAQPGPGPAARPGYCENCGSVWVAGAEACPICRHRPG